MINLSLEFEAASLHFNRLILEMVLQWFLLTTSVQSASRHHKRNLKNQQRAHQQQRKIENKSRVQHMTPRFGR